MSETKILETVSARTALHKRWGKIYTRNGYNALKKNRERLLAFLKFDIAIECFYKASISFKSCSQWREAGDSLLKCGNLFHSIRLNPEAAALYCESSEAFSKVDMDESIRVLKMAIVLNCDMGKFDVAGHLERKIAVFSMNLKHWEDAAGHFTRAANFLAGGMHLDQCDMCIEQSALCYLELNELGKAKDCYENIANGCIQSNLRRFSSRRYLLRALLCLIGQPLILEFPKRANKLNREALSYPAYRGDTYFEAQSNSKYKAISDLSQEYDQRDFMWSCSKHKLFIRNILRLRLECKMDELTDHLYYFNNVMKLDRGELRMLKVLIDEIRMELQRRDTFDEEEDRRQERERKRMMDLAMAKRMIEDFDLESADTSTLESVLARDRKMAGEDDDTITTASPRSKHKSEAQALMEELDEEN